MKAKLSQSFALLALVSACGTKGPLAKAPPMWGPDRAAYDAQQAEKAAEAADKTAKKQAEKTSSSATTDIPK
ncbi:lipoprotein [Candidatus Phycosocius spiralis]|uniref:Lipoprotein n=1 Tax=Candidatus Phycosocius spiralis TaxID=2815099 RepID=A0ABQ4PUC5_9PROT|nr:lipoprotein [Candidatus Phycosocius spiralis]GIU66318.1 hypothetical protein PsB1_0472 [Candidatus Phycosocius spiralis]